MVGGAIGRSDTNGGGQGRCRRGEGADGRGEEEGKKKRFKERGREGIKEKNRLVRKGRREMTGRVERGRGRGGREQ